MNDVITKYPTTPEVQPGQLSMRVEHEQSGKTECRRLKSRVSGAEWWKSEQVIWAQLMWCVTASVLSPGQSVH